VGYWEIDIVNNSNYWSDELFELFGLENDGNVMPLEKFLSYVHPEDRDLLLKSHLATIEKQVSLDVEFRFTNKHGVMAHYRAKGNIVTNDEGLTLKIEGTTQDISDLKHTQEKINSAQLEKEITLNRISDYVLSFDKEWRYTYINNAVAELNNLPKEEMLGRKIYELHPGLLGTDTWKKFQQAMSSEKITEFETYYEPYDLWLHSKLYPSVDGITIYHQNITEQKSRAEKKEKAVDTAKTCGGKKEGN